MGQKNSQLVDNLSEQLKFVQSTLDPRNAQQNSRNCAALGNIPIYILTLGDKNREKSILKSWYSILGKDVTRFMFYGVNGRKLWGRKNNNKEWDTDSYNSLIKAKVLSLFSGPGLKALSNAEVAVAFGALQMMFDIVTHDHEYALILEDDANVLVTSATDDIIDESTGFRAQKRFLTRFKCIMDNMPPHFDILRLGACFAYNQTTVINLEKTCNGINITKPDFALCAHGYIISKNACRTILENIFPLYTTIDHQIFVIVRSQKLNDYDVNPHIVGQDLFTDMGQSSIGYSKLEQLVLRALHANKISPHKIITSNVKSKQMLLNQLSKIW